jgi:hypothetical protein
MRHAHTSGYLTVRAEVHAYEVDFAVALVTACYCHYGSFPHPFRRYQADLITSNLRHKKNSQKIRRPQ